MKFENAIIQLSIILDCSEKTREYKQLLLSKLKDQYEKKAFEKYGIIDTILGIDSIHYE